MTKGENGPIADPDVASALADLLAQVEKEPISSWLRELADRLEAALDAASTCPPNDS